MRKTRVLIALLAGGCGRLGFDADPPVDDDDGLPAPAKLACGNAPSFAIPSGVREMAAVPTSKGFALFTSNQAKDLRGWTFAVDDAAMLAPSVKDARIDADITGAFGASVDNDEILVGAIHGAMATLGTRYHALDASLAPRTTPVTSEGRVIGAVPLATSGLATIVPQRAVASIRYEADDIAVHGIAGDGTDESTRTLGVAAEDPGELGITAAPTSYAVIWIEASASPNVARVALLDENYAIVKGPVTVQHVGGEDVIRPRLYHAPLLGGYAVTWFEKANNGTDDVYVQLLDDRLAPLLPAKLVQASAVRPLVAADDTGYYVAYVNVAAKPNRIDIAHVALDGTLAVRSAASSGGEVTAFTLVERNGQSILVYAEDTGRLWFDPLCP